jgi:hypothetical protein
VFTLWASKCSVTSLKVPKKQLIVLSNLKLHWKILLHWWVFQYTQCKETVTSISSKLKCILKHVALSVCIFADWAVCVKSAWYYQYWYNVINFFQANYYYTDIMYDELCTFTWLVPYPMASPVFVFMECK